MFGLRRIGNGAYKGDEYRLAMVVAGYRAFVSHSVQPVVARNYLFCGTTLDPHYDEGFVWLAIAYVKRRFRSAKAALDEALRLNPQNVIAKEIRSTMK